LVEANAFLWERGHLIDLNDFVPPDSDLHLRAGITINEGGEIAVAAEAPNGDRRAVLLIPCDDEANDSEGCRGAAVHSQTTLGAPVTNRVPAKQGLHNLLRGGSTRIVGRYHASNATLGPTR
jgi:hypothetical protein